MLPIGKASLRASKPWVPVCKREETVSYGDEANAVDKAKDFYINNTVNIAFNLMAAKAAATEETAAM